MRSESSVRSKRSESNGHSISIANPYGVPVAYENVPDSEFGDALRRFYNRAMEHPNTVIVLDGVTQTRNSFIEFVREFNHCAGRAAA
ncbi:MAG TPA: hypothetical protein VHA82_09600 [Ramlibacter sp.]|uniref:hypothetical protein n=1 Tax=Ramlibacter sp. TaxID=1917967 RepID=UPI002C31F043|nr:hypothetical protein [Ramlibacter sp.]HVZ44054.1 hypothetical protein [Ramlibacter sp.]